MDHHVASPCHFHLDPQERIDEGLETRLSHLEGLDDRREVRERIAGAHRASPVRTSADTLSATASRATSEGRGLSPFSNRLMQE